MGYCVRVIANTTGRAPAIIELVTVISLAVDKSPQNPLLWNQQNGLTLAQCEELMPDRMIH